MFFSQEAIFELVENVRMYDHLSFHLKAFLSPSQNPAIVLDFSGTKRKALLKWPRVQ